MEDQNINGICPIASTVPLHEIHQIMDTIPWKHDTFPIPELIVAISNSKSGTEGIGTYKAKHLKELFALAGANIPPEYAIIEMSSDETLVQFPNTIGAVLCLDALKNDNSDLIERSSIAASILLRQQVPTTEINGSLKEMHELVSAPITLPPAQLAEDTIGYIPFSKGGVKGEGTYTTGHLKRLFTFAGENIPPECPEISSPNDDALVTLPNAVVAVLCLDAMKGQNVPLNARGFLLGALFTPQLS